MREASRNLWVGLFVIISFGALGVLMVWFGEAPAWLGVGDWTLKVTGVHDLSGVSAGSSVTLNGVVIGRVQSLDFENRQRPDLGVVIIARIQEAYTVPRGAHAKVYGATLGIGTGHVAIVVEPGTSAGLLPTTGASIPGEMRSVLGEVVTREMVDAIQRSITHVGELTREWTPVGTNLASLIEPRTVEQVSRPGAAEKGLSPNVSTVFERIDQLVKNINAVLGDEALQEDVRAAVGDLKDATEELKSTVSLWKTESQRLSDNVNEGIDKTEANLDRLFDRLIDVAGSLDTSAKSLAQIANAISAGEGTAGLIVRDERLYESAVLALERFSESMATLQRYLGKVEEDGYIIVGKAPSGVLRKKFPIPEGSE
ncbi:MAG: MCE family protein [Planctomycetes bacterium]|nr:MCE family protein [Planctomycetota bacterium]